MRIASLILTLCCLGAGPAHASTAPVSADEAKEIAIEAYVYAYPLVLMDVTRQVATNVAVADAQGGARAPVNQFAHMPRYPDATFTDVARPNADTLYSSLWFDVAREPLVIHVPDSGGRYYPLPMLDLWTDRPRHPVRTTGGASGCSRSSDRGGRSPPAGMTESAPHRGRLMIGRTQTNAGRLRHCARVPGRPDRDAARTLGEEGLAADVRKREPESRHERPGRAGEEDGRRGVLRALRRAHREQSATRE